MAASGIVTRRSARNGDLPHGAKGYAAHVANTATATATTTLPASSTHTTSTTSTSTSSSAGTTPTKPRGRPRGRPRKPPGERAREKERARTARAMRALVRLQRDASPPAVGAGSQRRSARLQSGTAASLPAMLGVEQQLAERTQARKAWEADQDNFLRMCRTKGVSSSADANHGSDVIIAKHGVAATAPPLGVSKPLLQPKLVGLPAAEGEEAASETRTSLLLADKENEKSVAEENMTSAKGVDKVSAPVAKSTATTVASPPKEESRAAPVAQAVGFDRVFSPYVEPSNDEIAALMEELQKDHVARQKRPRSPTRIINRPPGFKLSQAHLYDAASASASSSSSASTSSHTYTTRAAAAQKALKDAAGTGGNSESSGSGGAGAGRSAKRAKKSHEATPKPTPVVRSKFRLPVLKPGHASSMRDAFAACASKVFDEEIKAPPVPVDHHTRIQRAMAAGRSGNLLAPPRAQAKGGVATASSSSSQQRSPGQRTIVRRGPRGPYKKRRNTSKERSTSSSRPRGGGTGRKPGRPRGSRNTSKEPKRAYTKRAKPSASAASHSQEISPSYPPTARSSPVRPPPARAHGVVSPPATALPPAHAVPDMFRGGLPIELVNQLPAHVLQNQSQADVLAFLRDKEIFEQLKIQRQEEAAVRAAAAAQVAVVAAYAEAAQNGGGAAYGRPQEHMAPPASSSSLRYNDGRDQRAPHHQRAEIPYTHRDYNEFLRRHEQGRVLKREEPDSTLSSRAHSPIESHHNPIAPPPTSYSPSAAFQHPHYHSPHSSRPRSRDVSVSPHHAPQRSPPLTHMPSPAPAFSPEVSQEQYTHALINSMVMQQMAAARAAAAYAGAGAGVGGAPIDLTADDSPPASPESAREHLVSPPSSSSRARKRKRGTAAATSDAKSASSYQGGPKRVHHGGHVAAAAGDSRGGGGGGGGGYPTFDERGAHHPAPMLVSFAG